MKKLIASLALGLFSVAAFAGEFADISIPELKAALASKSVTVIDVNGSDSWKNGHIPGAIDFDAARTQLASLLPKDKNALVVAYCGGPRCHAYAAAAKAAEALGYKNVKHLAAGISGWVDAKETVEKGK